jgi:hypothetical protein
MSKKSKLEELKYLASKPIEEIPESRILTAIKVLIHELSPEGFAEIKKIFSLKNFNHDK